MGSISTLERNTDQLGRPVGFWSLAAVKARVAAAELRTVATRSPAEPIKLTPPGSLVIRRKGDTALEISFRVPKLIDRRGSQGVHTEVERELKNRALQLYGYWTKQGYLSDADARVLRGCLRRWGEVDKRVFHRFERTLPSSQDFLASVHVLEAETEVNKPGHGKATLECPGFGKRAQRAIRETVQAIEYFCRTENCFFITFTLPTDLPEGVAVFNSYTSYILERFKGFVRDTIAKRYPGLWPYVHKWELQSRGALHLHICLGYLNPVGYEYPECWSLPLKDPKTGRDFFPVDTLERSINNPALSDDMSKGADAEKIRELFTNWWQETLMVVGERGGCDLMAASSPTQQKRQWQDIAHIACRVERPHTSLWSYLAKYMAKGDCAPGGSAETSRSVSSRSDTVESQTPQQGYPPRWWSANRAARDLRQMYSPIVAALQVSADAAISLLEGISETCSDLGFRLYERQDYWQPLNRTLLVAGEAQALQEYRIQLTEAALSVASRGLVSPLGWPLASDKAPLAKPGHVPVPGMSKSNRANRELVRAQNAQLAPSVLALFPDWEHRPPVSIRSARPAKGSARELLQRWAEALPPCPDVAGFGTGEADVACQAPQENFSSDFIARRGRKSSPSRLPRMKSKQQRAAEGDSRQVPLF